MPLVPWGPNQRTKTMRVVEKYAFLTGQSRSRSHRKCNVGDPAPVSADCEKLLTVSCCPAKVSQ